MATPRKRKPGFDVPTGARSPAGDVGWVPGPAEAAVEPPAALPPAPEPAGLLTGRVEPAPVSGGGAAVWADRLSWPFAALFSLVVAPGSFRKRTP